MQLDFTDPDEDFDLAFVVIKIIMKKIRPIFLAFRVKQRSDLHIFRC